MKTMFVIAGRPPQWVTDQTRLAAQQLTEDGRVLVTFTRGYVPEVQLPGMAGGSTILGFAPSGYPLWTGRLSSAIGLRRRQDATVVVLFDGGRTVVSLVALAVARLRRERAVVHDLRSNAAATHFRGVTDRILGALAHRQVRCSHEPSGATRSVVLALCNGDREFTRLVIDAATAIPNEAAVGWRFIIQSDHDDVDRMVAAIGRPDMISVMHEGVSRDVVLASDIVIVRHGSEDVEPATVAQRGAAAIVVGHPIARRVTRRFDGTWLSRADVSSLLVALESARGIFAGDIRSAPKLRDEVERVVSEVRIASLQSA